MPTAEDPQRRVRNAAADLDYANEQEVKVRGQLILALLHDPTVSQLHKVIDSFRRAVVDTVAAQSQHNEAADALAAKLAEPEAVARG